LQPLVDAVQASKVQLSAAGQVQAVPEHTVSVQAALKRRAMAPKRVLRFMISSRFIRQVCAENTPEGTLGQRAAAI
jgi:hypothetical protein